MLGQTSVVGDPLLSQAATARILGVSRQAVDKAIKRGTLQAEEGPAHKRMIRLSQVIAYGVRQGRSVEVMLERAQKELSQPVQWEAILELVLMALGLAVLFSLCKQKPVAKRHKAKTPA